MPPVPDFKKLEGKELEYGTRIGYWLVRESDKKRFFISPFESGAALERVAAKVLSDKTGYGYWVEYCSGLDVDRKPVWSNVDFNDPFI